MYCLRCASCGVDKHWHRNGMKRGCCAKDELLRELARGLVHNERLPDVAARLGLSPEEMRHLIFESHRSGEWARIVRNTGNRNDGRQREDESL